MERRTQAAYGARVFGEERDACPAEGLNVAGSGTFASAGGAAAVSILHFMETDRSGLERLPAGECLRLMASVPVGRIIYTRHALPAAEPVNFAVDRGDIVIRTGHSGKLAAAIVNAVVAFEADDLDFASRIGWSVTVVGRSEEVTDGGEIARLREIGIESWAPGERDHFIRIVPGIVTGRRLWAAGQTDSTDGERHPGKGVPSVCRPLWRAARRSGRLTRKLPVNPAAPAAREPVSWHMFPGRG
jgi:nitroimidazol reductase NimA-like FMN-containing flavoprotein (pyridoxamine 5'-phosphate oxidase superfamily)